MTSIIVPIFVCVVLPVAVVLIVSLTKMNAENKRSQIIIKAIEANKDVDTDKLIESLRKQQKTPRDILNIRLLRGCMFSLIGITLVIAGIINMFFKSSGPVTELIILGFISLSIGLSYLAVCKVTKAQLEQTIAK